MLLKSAKMSFAAQSQQGFYRPLHNRPPKPCNRGFAEIYGEYGEVAITSSGKTVAVWGEGFSWIGPGNTWFIIQL
jgi:hypothetical protein